MKSLLLVYVYRNERPAGLTSEVKKVADELCCDWEAARPMSSSADGAASPLTRNATLNAVFSGNPCIHIHKKEKKNFFFCLIFKNKRRSLDLMAEITQQNRPNKNMSKFFKLSLNKQKENLSMG